MVRLTFGSAVPVLHALGEVVIHFCTLGVQWFTFMLVFVELHGIYRSARFCCSGIQSCLHAFADAAHLYARVQGGVYTSAHFWCSGIHVIPLLLERIQGVSKKRNGNEQTFM